MPLKGAAAVARPLASAPLTLRSLEAFKAASMSSARKVGPKKVSTLRLDSNFMCPRKKIDNKLTSTYHHLPETFKSLAAR